MTILIFANGQLNEVEWIRPYFSRAAAIIAADGGTRHLFALRRLPDVVIGDMDSLTDEIKGWLETAEILLLIHPPAKDQTDLELALDYAIQNYPTETVLLFGAWGGRLDHSLANVLLLSHPHWRYHPIKLVECHEHVWLITAESTFTGSIGDTLSLIPIGGDVQIQSTTGLQWPLHNDTLVFGTARGISNTLTTEIATIQVQSGLLLCIQTISH